MSKSVVIIGASGHGKVIADTVLKSGDKVIGFLDDGIESGNLIVGFEVLGKISDYKKLKIIPQIEVIQSFLECESVKNVYIADTKAKTIENVESETDIKLYDNTLYQKPFNFII